MGKISWSLLVRTLELDTTGLECDEPMRVRIEVFEDCGKAFYFPKVWREDLFTMRPFESTAPRYSDEGILVRDFAFDSPEYIRASASEVIEAVVASLEHRLHLLEPDNDDPE